MSKLDIISESLSLRKLDEDLGFIYDHGNKPAHFSTYKGEGKAVKSKMDSFHTELKSKGWMRTSSHTDMGNHYTYTHMDKPGMQLHFHHEFGDDKHAKLTMFGVNYGEHEANKQSAKFMADADKGHLGSLNKRIRSGEKHLTKDRNEQLPLTGQTSKKFNKLNKK